MRATVMLGLLAAGCTMAHPPGGSTGDPPPEQDAGPLYDFVGEPCVMLRTDTEVNDRQDADVIMTIRAREDTRVVADFVVENGLLLDGGVGEIPFYRLLSGTPQRDERVGGLIRQRAGPRTFTFAIKQRVNSTTYVVISRASATANRLVSTGSLYSPSCPNP